MNRFPIYVMALAFILPLNPLAAEETENKKQESPPAPCKDEHLVKSEPCKKEEEPKKEPETKPECDVCKKEETCKKRIYLCSPCQDFSVFSWIGQTIGHGIGHERGYTSFGAFYVDNPYVAYSYQPYFDVRAHYHFFNKTEGAFNIGGGARYLSPDFEKVFGAGIYYDYRHFHHDYHQASFSLEALGYDYDLRLNGYLPFNGSHGRYRALPGLDAEIGMHLNRFCPFSWLHLYMAVGPYYYLGRGDCSSFLGGRARFAMDISIFTVEFKATNDRCFGRNYQGVFAINFVYGQPSLPCKNCCWRDWLQALLTIPVQRYETIVVDKKRKSCKRVCNSWN